MCLPGLPAGLTIAAIPEREEPRDALIGCSLADLKDGLRIGTSSLDVRRNCSHINPQLAIEMLRGNVDTRLRKLDEGTIRRDRSGGGGFAAPGLAGSHYAN